MSSLQDILDRMTPAQRTEAADLLREAANDQDRYSRKGPKRRDLLDLAQAIEDGLSGAPLG